MAPSIQNVNFNETEAKTTFPAPCNTIKAVFSRKFNRHKTKT